MEYINVNLLNTCNYFNIENCHNINYIELNNIKDINSFKLTDSDFSDFKNFLGLIPQAYTKSIANVTTKGNFSVKGKVNGILDATHIPKLDKSQLLAIDSLILLFVSV